MKACGIYAIKNRISGKEYIGSSNDCHRRFSEHRSRLTRGAHINTKMQAAWNKYGADAFEFVVVASVPRRDDLDIVEQQILDCLDVVRTGYNLCPTAGNTYGWIASPETRARMSEAAKKRDHSVQVKAMAASTRGRTMPQHVKDALRAGRGDMVASAETRLKMAQSARRRSRYSDADRQAMYEMRQSAATWRSIGAAFGVGHAAVMIYVSDWVARHEEVARGARRLAA